MKNTAIIIPTRLEARRFPNKPLAEFNSKPMILHVLNKAKESKVGEVFVATPDKKIFDIVNNNGGIAILTQKSHPSGSDRIYEVYSKKLKNNVDLIINLQGDMPNIDPNTISKLEKLLQMLNSQSLRLLEKLLGKLNENRHPFHLEMLLLFFYS